MCILPGKSSWWSLTCPNIFLQAPWDPHIKGGADMPYVPHGVSLYGKPPLPPAHGALTSRTSDSDLYAPRPGVAVEVQDDSVETDSSDAMQKPPASRSAWSNNAWRSSRSQWSNRTCMDQQCMVIKSITWVKDYLYLYFCCRLYCMDVLREYGFT